MIPLNELNENQRRAVEWDGGPLLVLAGPGSGKTLVLTLRIARLLESSPDERFRILGLTFTTKAASEMRTRLSELVPEARDRAQLSTFHAFCADLLRQHGSHIGLKPDFAILTQEADRQAVMSDAIAALRKEHVEVGPEDLRLMPVIDRLFANCASDSEARKLLPDLERSAKISALFSEYKKQLTANNRLDFAALLYFGNLLLASKPSVARQVQIVYPHVCVDEFQDTNLAQYRLLRAIVGSGPAKLFVVADDDQIIYQWNGASPERLKELRNDYSMEVIQLPANYRCPSEVIHVANNLIQHNLDRSPGKQPLLAIKAPDAEGRLRVQHFSSLVDEAEWIAEDVKLKPRSAWDDCALLGRTAKLLDLATEHIRAHGVEAHLAVRKNEFESVPLRWLHATLRLANARQDREQLRRLCKTFYELEGIDIAVDDVVANAAASGGDFLRAWYDVVLRREQLEPFTRQFLERSVSALVEKSDHGAFVPDAFGWIDQVQKRIGPVNSDVFADYPEEREMWEALQRSVDASASLGTQISLNTLLQEIDLAPKAAQPPPGSMRALTIHGAKGMEFKHVYLMGLVEDQLPSFQSIKKGETSREMQEERRSCFVALTRCTESLTLTYADEYFGWQKKPSRFLREMGILPAGGVSS